MRLVRLLAGISLLAVALPVLPAAAATVEVHMRGNEFDPRRVEIDPGDTVTWIGGGFRAHTVTSDDGLFESGRLGPGEEFSVTFSEEGFYYYHCRFHGRPRNGMWGVVVVGDPPEDEREKIFVPDDYPTIQDAVSAAKPGAAVIVRPGTYPEEVTVATPGLAIRGDDRFRTVVDGGGTREVGIKVTADDVSVSNLTVRDHVHAGIAFEAADDFSARKIDSIHNARFGISAVGSHGGAVKRSFAWGSGEAAFHMAECFGCGGIIDQVRAKMNMIGVEIVNATGVTVRGSRLVRNGIGMLARSDAAGAAAPGRALFVFGNVVIDNNTTSIPPAGIATEYGFPFGTGIWLAGVRNSTVLENDVSANTSYGVLVTDDLDGTATPVNNRVQDNVVVGVGSSLDLAWDGSGASDCFDGNRASTSGPPSIQERYPCWLRPFEGSPYEPVRDDVDSAIAAGPQTVTQKPPEPRRPRCQRGRPGCRR
jgi:plastocyanin